MRILVAEDRPKTADLLRRALGSEGYEVVLAYDGDRALTLGKSAEADLILLDVMLPVLDGFTVLRKLREDRVRTPVIILTARDSKADIVHGLDCGADDYLTKPFELDILLCACPRSGASRPGRGTGRVELPRSAPECEYLRTPAGVNVPRP